MIAVADTAPENVGADLRDYLDIAHAEAIVVGIGDAEWTPTRPRLDPSDADGMLRSNVKSLLQLRPWRSAGREAVSTATPSWAREIDQATSCV